MVTIYLRHIATFTEVVSAGNVAAYGANLPQLIRGINPDAAFSRVDVRELVPRSNKNTPF
jgi:hypothetical protein